uniref:Uncharacterized protein n=1 Tax=Panstrongylus lignarius TaxID=156445 RepID=A0A224Y5Q9_9HEMI
MVKLGFYRCSFVFSFKTYIAFVYVFLYFLFHVGPVIGSSYFIICFVNASMVGFPYVVVFYDVLCFLFVQNV